MRSLVKTATLGLAATLAVSAAFVGCSSGKKEVGRDGTAGTQSKDSGTITLNLEPVPGLAISSVHYQVSGGVSIGDAGIPTVEGDLPTPGSADNFSFGVPLRVGTGYQLSLTAQSDDPNDDITCTGAFGPFNIGPNQITDIALTLTCVDNTNGQVIGKVDVETTACPTLIVNYAVATPHTANVGSSLQVLSLATNNPAAPITYQWAIATNIGNFASATSKDTTFNCTAPGTNVLATVTASIGPSAAAPNGCSKSLSTRITCANVTCGNGVVDPGEACDPSAPGAPAGCLPNCTLANCGNGTTEPPVEQCEPPNTNVCTGTCQTRPALCNDGFLTPPEQCDPSVPSSVPPGGSCDPVSCTPVQAANCGDGVVGAGETCDNAGGNNYAIPNCGDIWGPGLTPPGGSADDCNPIESAACMTCLAGQPACATPSTDCNAITGNAAEGPAVGVARAELCRELLDCIYDSNCAAAGNTTSCLCGASADCAANPTGACREEVQRAGESTDFVTLGGRFGDEAFALGRASGRVDCGLAFNCAATCGTL